MVTGHLVAGKNATNLKAHLSLSVHHSDQFKEFSEAEQDRKTAVKRKLDESEPGKCCNEVSPYYLHFTFLCFFFLSVECRVLGW